MTGNGNSYQRVLAVLLGSVAVIGCSNDQGLPTGPEEAAFPTAAEELAMMEENKRDAAKRGWIDVKPIEWPPNDAADPSSSENAAGHQSPTAPQDDAEIQG